MHRADQFLPNPLVTAFVKLIEGELLRGADRSVNTNGNGDQRDFQMAGPSASRFHSFLLDFGMKTSRTGIGAEAQAETANNTRFFWR